MEPSHLEALPGVTQPQYEDSHALEETLTAIRKLPPLVTSWEVDHLKNNWQPLRQRSFAIAGWGIAPKPSMTASGTHREQAQSPAANEPGHFVWCPLRIIRVGRMAGQYAKPRSSDFETIQGVTLPSYRGDLINDRAFTREARTPDPHRLLRGYERSAVTLNFVRALSEGGFADLHQPSNWNLCFDRGGRGGSLPTIGRQAKRCVELHGNGRLHPQDRSTSSRFLCIARSLASRLRSGANPTKRPWCRLLRLLDPLPWIGERTRQIQGAHVEFLRGVRNPVAVR